jgi:hypothetical protein
VAAWRYDFYLLILKTIFYSLAALVRKILFSSPLEDKSHIFAPPCNILYFSTSTAHRILRTTVSCSKFGQFDCALKLKHKLATELSKTFRTDIQMQFEVYSYMSENVLIYMGNMDETTAWNPFSIILSWSLKKQLWS